MTDFPLIPHELRPLNAAQLRQLMRDLNPGRIAQRSQGGSKLSYLEGWDVRASLVKIFGFGGFSSETIAASIVKVETDLPRSGGGTTNFRVTAMCTSRLYIHQLGAVYTETAVASQSGADIGEVADFAVKTAETDAMKRSAVNLGTQFGMSLYDSGSILDVIGAVMADGQRGIDIDALAMEHALNVQQARVQLEADQQSLAAAIAENSTIPDGEQEMNADDEAMALAADKAEAESALAAAFKQADPKKASK